ncbi:MAG TPA: hypothetical protein PLW75_06320 [Hyphomicrobium sp.]|nr:hypothetical protein [Hyphomicrobium sp.]
MSGSLFSSEPMTMAAAFTANPHVPPPPLDVVPASLWAPGRSDAWWWLYLPLVLFAGLLTISLAWPDSYRAYILPEGYGFLELGHFLIPFAAFVLSLRLLRLRVVREGWPLWAFILIFGLGNFYIAGEEHSWGQHFFNWNTPAYWTDLNRQAETNLHNVSHWFNQRPRLVLEIGIAIGGILVPLIQSRVGLFRQPLLALLTPPVQLSVVAGVALVVKVINHLWKGDVVETELLIRPSEALETFIYLFLLYYVVVLGRRLGALDAVGVRKVPL